MLFYQFDYVTNLYKKCHPTNVFAGCCMKWFELCTKRLLLLLPNNKIDVLVFYLWVFAGQYLFACLVNIKAV